ncbi:MAG: signal recognition particle-docking protein FtsY, partial [Cutibacterium granulosum]|nr:signal recognition particle-docking protein FtsY [Cutibacterium granulosum]
LVEKLRSELAIDGVADPQRARTVLHDELVTLVNPDMDRELKLDHEEGKPAVILMVGVNGTGKTTTCGKIARMLVADGKSVVLGAADTFRAAAGEQLETWGERVGVRTVRKDAGADPASVAYEAVQTGIDDGADVVIVDTAGRLHNKAGLMDELGKVKRVIEKLASVSEVLLVLDATTGQNGLTQARVFAEVVDVTGVVLSKLDGSAKGGIVVQVQQELGVPVKLIGLGEGPDDLAPFEAAGFVDGLMGQ